jgi:class 3 adenylate cyclase
VASAPLATRSREARAILFADLKGFSKLPDRLTPLVNELVFGAFAAVLAPYRRDGALVEANTWGDAALVVMTDVVAAADVALRLLETLETPAIVDAFDGAPPAMRIGGHFGPVFPAWNPIREEPCVVGAHMAIGARIEPVAPVGAAWVTEHFAAALVLAEPKRFSCEVVGRTRMAKDFGELRVLRLTRLQTWEKRPAA